MNLLEKLKLVEPINGSEEEAFVEHEDPAPVVTADFSANAGTSAADIIDAIYNATDMEDKSNSIYRVKDLMNTIPAEKVFLVSDKEIKREIKNCKACK